MPTVRTQCDVPGKSRYRVRCTRVRPVLIHGDACSGSIQSEGTTLPRGTRTNEGCGEQMKHLRSNISRESSIAQIERTPTIVGIQTAPAPFCPDCGARMILKLPRPDQEWNAFWGCVEFPDCTGSREIGEDGKPVYDEIAPGTL